MHSSHLHITLRFGTLFGIFALHCIWQTTRHVWHSISSPPLLHILHAFSLFPLHLLNGLMFLAFTLTMFLCCGDDMFHFSRSVICVFSVFCFTPVLCCLFLTFITSTSLPLRVFDSIPLFCINNCVCFLTVLVSFWISGCVRFFFFFSVTVLENFKSLSVLCVQLGLYLFSKFYFCIVLMFIISCVVIPPVILSFLIIFLASCFCCCNLRLLLYLSVSTFGS